jgi:hypothetical protein
MRNTALAQTETVWTPEEVKSALEEAGRTLMMLPMPKNGLPASHANNWPDIVRNYAEFFAAQILADQDTKEELMAGRNAVRLKATAKQVADMDQRLEWLWLIEDELTRTITMAKALKYPASDRPVASNKKLARIYSCSHEHIRRLHYKGLTQISQRLSQRK